MWFLSARNARRTPSASARRGAFRPRLETLEDRCLLSAGALDTMTFGTFPGNPRPPGVVNGPICANAVVVYPNTGSPAGTANKIVAGGFVINTYGYDEFALARYNADGSPDTTFGTNGVVKTVVGVLNSYIQGIAIDANGNIVAVGTAVNRLNKGKNTQYDPVFAVARYTSTGVLDTTFGSGGIATTIVEIGGSTGDVGAAAAVAIEPPSSPYYPNDIYVAGTASPNAADEFALARYTSKGVLDTSFNNSGGPGVPGLVETPLSQFGAGATRAWAKALTFDGGDIVVAGTININSMAVADYTSTGALDTSFNGTGIVTGLAGPTDPSGHNGVLAHGVLVQSGTGDIVVAGNYFPDDTVPLPTSTEKQILVRLYGTGPLAGQPDPSFGVANNPNYSPYVINPYLFGAEALAQDANGDLLAAAATLLNVPSTPKEIGVAAYLPNGAPDMTFGNSVPVNGTSSVPVVDFPGGSYGIAMAIQADGKIVVAGIASSLARFLPPDTKIGSFTVNPNPVTAGSLVTLTVSGILNSNPTSTISNVVFYLDAIGGTPLTVTLISNSNGTWTYSFDTTGLATGTHTLYAEAVDSNGIFSDPLAVTLKVL